MKFKFQSKALNRMSDGYRITLNFCYYFKPIFVFLLFFDSFYASHYFRCTEFTRHPLNDSNFMETLEYLLVPPFDELDF